MKNKKEKPPSVGVSAPIEGALSVRCSLIRNDEHFAYAFVNKLFTRLL